jgi:CBS domain-containing protein
LLGIASDADLIRFPLPPDVRRQPQWLPDRHRPAPRVVADVMSTTVESMTPGADVADVARMMVDEHLRCLPIVDGTGLVGVITRRDLLRCSLARDDTAAHRLTPDQS